MSIFTPAISHNSRYSKNLCNRPIYLRLWYPIVPTTPPYQYLMKEHLVPGIATSYHHPSLQFIDSIQDLSCNTSDQRRRLGYNQYSHDSQARLGFGHENQSDETRFIALATLL